MRTTKVFLREKKISKGRKSLYLDFYPPVKNSTTGKETRREFLRLYIFEKPKKSTDKQHNKETRALAENIRAKRQIEVQNEDYGFTDKANKNINFLEYFKKLSEKHYSSKSNYDNWMSSYKHLCKFTNDNLKIGDINKQFIEDFKHYFVNKSNLAANTKVSYFNKCTFRSKLTGHSGAS